MSLIPAPNREVKPVVDDHDAVGCTVSDAPSAEGRSVIAASDVPPQAAPLEAGGSAAIAADSRITGSPDFPPDEEADRRRSRTLLILMALGRLEPGMRADRPTALLAKPIGGEDLPALLRALTEGHL